MKKHALLFLPVLMLGMVFASAGCSKKIVKEDMAQGSGSSDASSSKSTAEAIPDDRKVTEEVKAEDLGGKGAGDRNYKSLTNDGKLTKVAAETGGLYTIHFDFDQYTIRESDRELLANNAKWLSINPAVKVRIEGYADERGETEYNLALGDKRARSVEKYLRDMGIKFERLSTVSFGEENPVDSGHDEDAWSRNRRAEFKIIN